MEAIALGTCVVRDTGSRKGRTRAVTPGTTASRYLHYGRIIQDARDAPLTFETGGFETVFIGLGGSASIAVAGASFVLGKYDSLYVPRQSSVTVTPGSSGCDFAEIAAPV